MNKDNIKFATHLEVRDELIKMQRCGGAMITPFALYKLFYELDSVDKIKARSRAYFFCALCNEYWLFYCYDKHPKTEFFILDDRWEKYHITPYIMKDSTEFLQRINLITCGTKELVYYYKPVTTYKINLEMLQACRIDIERYYEEERAKRKPF